jgi:nucleoside-diphosphate-sugar epimerase
MRRVLITGPTGFIGRHCLDRLLSEDCEIHAVSRRNNAAGGDRVRWHEADLREPAEARGLIAAIRPSHLLHLAWEATPRTYSRSPENLGWLQASVAMIGAFGEVGGERFVGAGSSAEYQSGHDHCTEDLTPLRPSTVYGKCKAACWLGVEAAAQYHGFSAAWGRIFLPYGPGDPPGRLIPSVLAALDQRRPIETTHGRQLRDFIYAPDAADLLVRLLFSTESGAFNIGTGCATTIRSAIEYLADRRGGRELVRIGTIEPPAGEPLRLIADMTRVHARLGWSAATSIEAGLTRLLRQR